MLETVSQINKGWDARWPACPPIAEQLKEAYSLGWIRFYGLPNGKRYPDSPDEYGEILQRHNTLLGELLVNNEQVYVILAEWTNLLATTPSRKLVKHAQGIKLEYWRSIIEDPDEKNPEFISHRNLFVGCLPWASGVLDGLLESIIDDEIGGVIIMPQTLDWAYHPYDGGMDMIFSTTKERNAIRDRHQFWLG